MAINAAWGIDLGNRALKAIKLIREGDRFRIDDFEVIEHEQILSVAGDNREGLQKTALARFVERHNAKGSPVGVSVSGQSSFARFIKLPPVESKKIPEIVRFEAIQQIPFPLDDVEWSYQLFQEKDSPDVEVGIFAMRKDLINHHISLFTDLGLNVQTVQMHPLAVYNGMRYDAHMAQTTMFMDAGAENTDLIIADGETVWLRTLPIGGNSFTETLAKSFKLSFAKAEELKRNAATSKYAKQIFQAMRPVFADLVAEVQRSIGFYASVHRDARIQRIIALGSTFQLPGLQKYLQQNLQLPVEKLDAFKSAAPIDARLAANLPESVGSLAGAYGLALQTLGEAKVISSLLPEGIRRRKMWQEKTKWFATAAATFLVGTLGIGASYFYNDTAYESNSSLRQQNQKILREATDRSQKWKSEVENVGEPERKKALEYRALQDYHGLWVDLVTDILSTLPKRTFEDLKKTPRPQRDQITIETMQSRYWADMKKPLTDPDFSQFLQRENINVVLPGAPGADMSAMAPPDDETVMGTETPTATTGKGKGKGKGAAAPPPPDDNVKRRGYLITIRGHTPRPAGEASLYIVKEMVSRLQAINADKAYQAGKPYYFARVELLKSGPRIKRNETGTGNPGQLVVPPADALDPDMLGGAEENLPIMPRPLDKEGRAVAANPSQDRIFPEESIEGDIAFTVLAAVVLDPPAPAPKSDQ
jgi:type IV pilus assembly protein PilM